MNFSRIVLCTSVFLLVLTQVAEAQYEMKSGVHNRLSQRVPASNPNHISPVGPGTSPIGDPTITPQFSNVVESSSGSAAITSGYPQNTAVKLTHSSLGTTFASGVPKYFYGDRITPPTSIVSLSGTVLDTSAQNYWRAEPVRPGEILANPSGAATTDYRSGEEASIAALVPPALENFYYSPHARAVFANTPGTVEITWRSSVPDASNKYIFYKERFSVSSATSTPVRTMYWTEKSFNGPRVSIPSGKIVTVNPVFSNVFPETVAEEYVVVGTSTADPNAEASAVLRTLWFEKANGVGELHAYNLTGRILIEYLGELKEDGSHVFLGLDIISVERALPAVTATISLGEQIIPYGELPSGSIGFNTDESLVGSPVSTTGGVDQINYYGTNPRPDGTLAYYAERENDIEDRVTFYWLEPLPFSIPDASAGVSNVKIQWPKYLNKYLQVWPGDVGSFAINRVDVDGSSGTTGTGLPFLGGNIPQIVYQDSSQGDATLDSATQLLLVNLQGEADQQNRTLLKFTGSNGGVWYVRLLTAGADQVLYGTANDLASGTATAYVGERLTPPSADLTQAGYVAAGKSYSPGAYVNPFTSGVSAAAMGAIIPVNVIPGQNTLKIWWFKKTPAKSAEFTDMYTPAKIVTYTLAHRESTTVVSETFDDGATGWTENTTTILNGTNKFLGSYGAYAVDTSTNVAVNSPVTSKTFAVAGVDDGGLEIAFRLLRLDTWDNELFRVFVNDRVVIERSYGAAVTTDATGSVTISDVQYDWTVTRDAAGYTQLGGGSSSDQAFNFSIRATPTTQAGLDSLASLKIGFGSNLNQAASDESFGIDDFSIRLPVPEIVLASNNGTGVLPTEVADYTIYNQPDATLVGYNPNEEHALLLGGRGYALRDDLNVTVSANPE